MDMAQSSSVGGYSPRRVAALGGGRGGAQRTLAAAALTDTPGDSGLAGALRGFQHPDVSLASLSRGSHVASGVPSSALAADPPHWTREMDEVLLTGMLQAGTNAQAEQQMAQQLKQHDHRCTIAHVRVRMQLYGSKL